MRFNYYFIPQGAKAEITENNFNFSFKTPEKTEQFEFSRSSSIILDTGNFLQPGIVDHHQPNSGYENSCVAAIIINEPEKYLGHLLGQEEINIVTHFAPDLDALTSVFYTRKFLQGHKMNSVDLMIAEYVNLVDMGKLVLDPEQPIGIASLWLSFTSELPYPQMFEQIFNSELLETGLKMWETIIFFLQNSSDPNPWEISAIAELEELKLPSERILNDIKAYEQDVKSSKTGIIPIYNLEANGFDMLEVIITCDAKSFLWKYWVRGDRKNTVYGDGFTLTCLHMVDKKRAIISTDPTKPYNLKGLGLYLDTLEILKLQEKGYSLIDIVSGMDEQKNAGPRPGFYRNNPWYDGRGMHNYTIIDAPRGGTLLTSDEIDESIFAFHLWQQYGKQFEFNSKNVCSVEELYSLKNISIGQRPYVGKSELTSSFNEEIDNYTIELCLEQVNKLLSLPIHHIFDEQFGTEIEEICREEINDVFILNERIRSSVQNLFLSSYLEAENITKSEHWLNQLSGFISDGFSFFSSEIYQTKKNDFILHISESATCYFSYQLLNNCSRLPPQAFSILYEIARPIFIRELLFNQLLEYQEKHKDGFKKEHFHFMEQTISASSDREEQLNLFRLMLDDDWDSTYFEEIPIYSYNQIKNYIDDLFYLSNKQKNGNLSDDVKNFLSTDFKEVFQNDYMKIELEKFENIRSIFKDEKKHLLNELFGERCISLKNEKYVFINAIAKIDSQYRKKKDALSKVLIAIDLNQLANENFKYARNIIDELEGRNFDLEGEFVVSNKFINELRLFEELEGLNMMFDRSRRFCVLGALQGLTGKNNFTNLFNELIYSLFRLLTLYTNFNDQDEIENQLKRTTELLGLLRLKSAESDFLNSYNLREKIAAFVPIIHEEINSPVEDTEFQISTCLSQYELITGPEGILELVNKLPYFYRIRFEDLFQGFKRYYMERLQFFRNNIQALIDESENGDEEKMTERYIETCNNLINESVSFDWQELKDVVDNQVDDEKIRNLFYDKYFHWLHLNISSERKEELYKYNSEVRFAEGKSGEEIDQIILNLPEKQHEVSLQSLTVDFQLKHIIKHRPTKLIHNAYSFLIEHFISKYHVDNVRDTLAKFSTKFPWYYHFFTIKKYLRGLFLLLIVLILAAGAFDTNLYNGKLAPLPQWFKSHIGSFSFGTTALILQVFWGIIISLTFIVPLILFFKFLFERYVVKEKDEEGNKLNFFKLIESIEGKRSHLLYIPFIMPLLIVVLQMSSSDTVLLINKIEGFRFFSTFILVIGLTIISVYNYVKERNESMSTNWLIKRTEHMLWLHLIQAFVISIFVIDLILRFQVSTEDFGQDENGLFFLGMSKYISIVKGPIDVVIMPTFTIMIAILTLFFSFFIEKIFGGNQE